MKKGKIINSILVSLAVLFSALAFSCADAEGLHDQNALLVTFEFTGFGDNISGSYSIPGNFDSWDNKTADVTLSKGEGKSNQIAITTSNIQFSLVPVGEWTRPWYSESLKGNGMDGTANKYQNFYFDGLDLSAGEATILIDASSGTAAPVLK